MTIYKVKNPYFGNVKSKLVAYLMHSSTCPDDSQIEERYSLTEISYIDRNIKLCYQRFQTKRISIIIYEYVHCRSSILLIIQIMDALDNKFYVVLE